MAKTSFFLDTRGTAKDGKRPIHIRISHNGTSTTVATGIRVLPKNWDGKQVVRCSEAPVLNVRLNEQKAKIDRELTQLLLDDSSYHLTASQLKDKALGPRVQQNRHTMVSLFADYMDGDMKEGTKSIYNSTLRKVVSFGGQAVAIEDIDLKWLRSFDKFLSQTMGANGRSMYLRSLRAVINFARHNGIICQYPFDNFHIRQEPTEKRSIPVELLRELGHYQVTPVQSMYRDYFFLMFFLIGINAKDLLLAKKSQIVNGRLEYIREKTNKKYSIKLEPEALDLIKKHSGKGEYLLDAMDHCLHHQNFTRQINESLQTIGLVEEYRTSLFGGKTEKRIVPLIPGITTYYARHSWATIAYEIGIPIDTISQALGHSFGNRTTLIYIKPDQSKVDEANRKVIDYFFK